MTDPRRVAAPRRGELWAYAAAFGALWGAAEVTIGSFVHALRIPFGGTTLAALGAALLVAQRQFCPRRGLSIATALIAATLKGFSPAGTVLGPMLAISVEGLLVEAALLPWPRARLGAFVGGFLVVFWSLMQTFFTQAILYGADILDIYARLVDEGARTVGLAARHGWFALIAVAALVSCIGGGVALYGRRVAARVAAEERGAGREVAAPAGEGAR